MRLIQRGGDEQPRPASDFLKAHRHCELCWTSGERISQAATALAREPSSEDTSAPWTLRARMPLCDWCAKLMTWAREDDGKEIWGCTVHGFPVSPSHPWNQGRSQKH